jgi:hypothetical protein
LVLDRMRLDGTSNMTYVMTVMQLAMFDQQYASSVHTEDDEGDRIFVRVHAQVVRHSSDLCVTNICPLTI